MSKPWTLVSPASRGIGLQLARQLLKTTSVPVIATARKDLSDVKSQILQDLDVDPQRLEVLKLDVTDDASIATAASHCSALFPSRSHHLHLAFLLPGILHPEKSPQQISPTLSLETFRTNTLGPMLLTKHFSPFLPTKRTSLPSPPPKNLPSSATLALMSARVGSISDNELGGWYSYRASKAGVNSFVKGVDVWLRQRCGEKSVCVGLHPGTVKTGLSEEFWGSTPKEKLFEAGWAAGRLCEVVQGVGVEGRGRCWDWKGEEIPP